MLLVLILDTYALRPLLSTMALFYRGAKPSRDWNANDLAAYRITIVPQKKKEFFGTINLPDPAEPSLAGFMAAETRKDAEKRKAANKEGENKKTRQLLHYLDLAMDPKIGQEAAAINFAVELLKTLDYDDESRIVFIRRSIPFLVNVTNTVAQIDVCIMDDENQILLLLQDDNSLTNVMNVKDPEPQVIAGAIAAFALNNQKRERDLHLPICDSVMIPCLTMVDSSPIFYKVTVTAALSKAVQTGTFPAFETRVGRYIPTLPCKRSDGMRPLPNRLEILRCLEAFKKYLGGVTKTERVDVDARRNSTPTRKRGRSVTAPKQEEGDAGDINPRSYRSLRYTKTPL